MFTFLQLSSQPVSQNNQICPDFPATHKGTFTDGTWWWRCGDTWRTYIVTYQTVQLLFSCHTTPTPRLQPQNPVVHEFTTLTKTLVNSHWTQHRGYIKNSWAYTTDTLMWVALVTYAVTSSPYPGFFFSDLENWAITATTKLYVKNRAMAERL